MDWNEKRKLYLISKVQFWANNHQKLESVFIKGDHINEIKLHSENLDILSKAALKKLNNQEVPTEIISIIEKAKIASGGTLLAVVSGLEMIIKS